MNEKCNFKSTLNDYRKAKRGRTNDEWRRWMWSTKIIVVEFSNKNREWSRNLKRWEKSSNQLPLFSITHNFFIPCTCPLQVFVIPLAEKIKHSQPAQFKMKWEGKYFSKYLLIVFDFSNENVICEWIRTVLQLTYQTLLKKLHLLELMVYCILRSSNTWLY